MQWYSLPSPCIHTVSLLLSTVISNLSLLDLQVSVVGSHGDSLSQISLSYTGIPEICDCIIHIDKKGGGEYKGMKRGHIYLKVEGFYNKKCSKVTGTGAACKVTRSSHNKTMAWKRFVWGKVGKINIYIYITYFTCCRHYPWCYVYIYYFHKRASH